MRVATWNINGIKARLENLLVWLEAAKPDIACLQEIKSVDEAFPREAIEALGYHVETHGQKGFNGVAILSLNRPDDIIRGLPGDETDEQARFIEASFSVKGGSIRIGCLYLPNGNPVETEKYPYKLAWMDRLERHAASRQAFEEAYILAGDYNVIPTPEDCYDPAAWAKDALFLPETRQAYRRLLSLGLTDAIAASGDTPGRYTFWDYQAGAWPRNNGIRIDHMLLSPECADRLQSVMIDKDTRSWERPSDHVPVICELQYEFA
ncbi:exodeoxyribonuclease III [Martelella alba]|uniref:Exodeoxyribonuclease III n=1 Tax=Martelella alba TaxID=2590451 RepID=A0A506UJL2_9HYPH|nr:exodeoxyribonuclease III [Martelella alba]TPW33510.1 exodeoxyribonuclease III [Martelella alba]